MILTRYSCQLRELGIVFSPEPILDPAPEPVVRLSLKVVEFHKQPIQVMSLFRITGVGRLYLLVKEILVGVPQFIICFM
jgi:hypothetical protein